MSPRHKTKFGNMVHEKLMPGMLRDELMKGLDNARGLAFDRLFLVDMIGHHQGAIALPEPPDRVCDKG